ncbi:MAG: Caldesmon [Deltaproteobacteria bacterium CG23_combo_of_CG06-09_8_20_14_all_60_8]|nr:MAG: hypothetical protein AUK28_04780 [Desulfobacterales bacterium CG2_30_60_27]PIP43606.1 MAG: Caldesmon [Deltaproteobacteria bacterium CG23_combo_of_CG06-09_8_20_14_all_60_8]
MTNPTAQISCPSCGFLFNAEEALEKQLLAKLKAEYEAKAAKQAQLLASQRETLEKERQVLNQQRANQAAEIRKQLEQERGKLQQAAEGKAREELGQQVAALQQENKARREENLSLKQKEIELLRRENELKERQECQQLDMEKQLLEKQAEIEARARKSEQERLELRFKEYEKQLVDQKKLIEEMKRKAEQGSMQMQGEVQEIALEELLVSLFPFDGIAEVAKGVRGADVIQTVVNPLQQQCGKIIYESKRTKAFCNDWLGKLKADQLDQGAELAVIVTETMPSDMDRFGQKDGVWIANFQEIKSLAFVLREMLLHTHSVRVTEENKGDKMEMLYHYLTSPEFRQRVEAIVEGFSELRTELDREKRAMQRIWKTREKQIEKVINNTIDMYGSVKGIAGSAIGVIPALELPGQDEEGPEDDAAADPADPDPKIQPVEAP